GGRFRGRLGAVVAVDACLLGSLRVLLELLVVLLLILGSLCRLVVGELSTLHLEFRRSSRLEGLADSDELLLRLDEPESRLTLVELPALQLVVEVGELLRCVLARLGQAELSLTGVLLGIGQGAFGAQNVLRCLLTLLRSTLGSLGYCAFGVLYLPVGLSDGAGRIAMSSSERLLCALHLKCLLCGPHGGCGSIVRRRRRFLLRGSLGLDSLRDALDCGDRSQGEGTHAGSRDSGGRRKRAQGRTRDGDEWDGCHGSEGDGRLEQGTLCLPRVRADADVHVVAVQVVDLMLNGCELRLRGCCVRTDVHRRRPAAQAVDHEVQIRDRCPRTA